MKRTNLGYDRRKAGEFYEAGYKLNDENILFSDLRNEQIDGHRKRHFIVFNF